MRQWADAASKAWRYVIRFAQRVRSRGIFDELASKYSDRSDEWVRTARDAAASYGFRVCGTKRTRPGRPLEQTTPAAPPAAEFWPDGKKGWTVVLLSTTSKDEANDLALKARKDGVPAGILQSDNYKNLSSGLWMVWAGRFSSEDAAYAAAEEYRNKGYVGESVDYIRTKGSDDSSDGGGDTTTDTTPTTPATDGG